MSRGRRYDAIIIGSGPNGLSAAITLVAMIAVTARLDVQLAVVALVIAPALFLLSGHYRRRLRSQSRHAKKFESTTFAVVQEILGALRVVKAFAQEQYELDRLTDKAHELYQSRMRPARFNSRYSSTLQALPMMAQLGVLALGGWLAMRGTQKDAGYCRWIPINLGLFTTLI